MKTFIFFMLITNIVHGAVKPGKDYRRSECFGDFEKEICAELNKLWKRRFLIEKVEHHLRGSRGIFFRIEEEESSHLGMLGLDLEMMKDSIAALLRKQMAIGAHYILRF